MLLLLIFSINKTNEEENWFNLPFKNGVAETTISIKKNTTYHAHLTGANDGQNIEFELVVENASTSPLNYFNVVKVIESLDVSKFTSHIDLSEKQKSNNLVLSGNYTTSSFFTPHYYIGFSSSCDIPNLQIKITISANAKSTEKSTESTESTGKTFILTVVLFIVIVSIIGICICIVSIFISKRNQKIQPTYAPIQPPI